MDQGPDRHPIVERGAEAMIAGRGPPGLSPVATGALWLVCSGVSFSLMGALVRHIVETHAVHPFQIAFFRNLLVLAPMLLFIRRMNLSLVPRRSPGLHLLRAAVEFAAMLAWFTGVSLLPLGNFTAVSFTSVLFAALVARMVLGESLGPHRLFAIFAGFAGALIILRPGPDGLSVGALAAVGAAVSIAASRVAARVLAKTEPANALLFYMMLYTTPPAAIAANLTWSDPAPAAFLPIVLTAVAAASGHFCLAQAYRSAEVSALAPFDFLQIPIAGLIGFAALGQTPDLMTGIGAAVIVGSTIYALNRARP